MLEILAATWVLTLKTDPIDDRIYARADMSVSGASFIVGCSQATYGEVGFNIRLPANLYMYGDTRVLIRFDGLPAKEYYFTMTDKIMSPERHEAALEIIASLQKSRSALFRVQSASKFIDIPVSNMTGQDVIGEVQRTCQIAENLSA